VKTVLVALFAAAAVLVGIELGLGAAHAGDVKLADPCTAQNDKVDALQRVILDGLDGATGASSRSRSRCAPGCFAASTKRRGAETSRPSWPVRSSASSRRFRSTSSSRADSAFAICSRPS